MGKDILYIATLNMPTNPRDFLSLDHFFFLVSAYLK